MVEAHPPVFCHVNRRGVAHYLHRLPGSKGRACFYITRSAGGVEAQLPPALEVTENEHGQVSVRRVSVRRKRVPAELDEK